MSTYETIYLFHDQINLQIRLQDIFFFWQQQCKKVLCLFVCPIERERERERDLLYPNFELNPLLQRIQHLKYIIIRRNWRPLILRLPFDGLVFDGLQERFRQVQENRKKYFLTKFVPIFTSFSFLEFYENNLKFRNLFLILRK